MKETPTTVHLTPSAEGLKVPDPDKGGYLPEEGRAVRAPLSTYWRRRLNKGEVLKLDAAPTSAKPKKKAAAPPE